MDVVAYERLLVTIREYDDAWPLVAEYLTQRIISAAPGAKVVHVGSTAVPGLAGKGTIDLMVVVPAAAVGATVAALLRVGLQTRPNGFPPRRPLLFAAVRDLDQRVHQVHIHVVPAEDEEVKIQAGLVAALRDDPALRAEYAALKRSIVQSGTNDPVPYSTMKDQWLARTLSRLGLPPTPAAFGG